MDPRINLEKEDMAVLLSAMYFSARKHRDQRRKDPRGTPYINHPIEVTYILYFEGNVSDVSVLAAAVLHDTIEDTDTSLEEVAQLFGPGVASLVAEVSDDKNQPKEVRKRLQIENAPLISFGAKLVKLADKISNLRDVCAAAPKNWSLERQHTYFEWSQAVINGLRGTNEKLEHAFDEVCSLFFQRNNNLDVGKDGAD